MTKGMIMFVTGILGLILTITLFILLVIKSRGRTTQESSPELPDSYLNTESSNTASSNMQKAKSDDSTILLNQQYDDVEETILLDDSNNPK
jgi:cytoskeletal protein RodZ